MIYLYSALGVVMVTGIMAIFEMGLSLRGQSDLLKPVDPYQGYNLDQEMLSLLYHPEHIAVIQASLDQGGDLCTSVLDRRDECVGLSEDDDVPDSCMGMEDSSLQRLVKSGVPTNGIWFDSCALESTVDRHRMLLQLDPVQRVNSSPYRLFSCGLSVDQAICKFESAASGDL